MALPSLRVLRLVLTLPAFVALTFTLTRAVKASVPLQLVSEPAGQSTLIDATAPPAEARAPGENPQAPEDRRP